MIKIIDITKDFNILAINLSYLIILILYNYLILVQTKLFPDVFQ